jgi:antitoxin StbD
MQTIIPITKARANLAELVAMSDDHDVVLVRHGQPAAVLISARRHEQLVEEFEDALDKLSIYEREYDTIPFELNSEIDQ